ncbi:hypothetical protein ACAN107058_19290 [Paracidovorax anthurii]
MARCLPGPAGRAGPRTRALRAGRTRAARAPAAHGLAAHAQHALREHRGGGGAARLPGRPRHRGAAGLAHALERARDGGARQPGLWRAGRPHRELRERRRPVRDRLQPLLPCARGHRAGPAPGRPGLLPAAQRAGRVCARLPRRPANRARPAALSPGNHRARRGRAGALQLPASVADARFLAVPHGLDGHRAHQQHLPRALHALSHAPRPARLRGPQGVGRVRRRRDGRAREHERAHARRARGAGQPRLGGQLQPAAARRPGARQRAHRR